MWPAAWGKHRMLLVNYPCRWTVLRVVCRHAVHPIAADAAAIAATILAAAALCAAALDAAAMDAAATVAPTATQRAHSRMPDRAGGGGKWLLQLRTRQSRRDDPCRLLPLSMRRLWGCWLRPAARWKPRMLLGDHP